MNIVIITQEEPFYLPSFIQKVAEKRKKDIKAIVILSPKKRSESMFNFIKKNLYLMGTKVFVITSLLFIGYKILDKWSYVINTKRYYSVRRIALRNNIPLLTPKDVNTSKFLAKLKAIQPDVIVSVSAPQIFKKPLLRIPRYGCINIHSAPLPKYRGLMPNFWVLANNEKETAVTVHYVVSNVDDGDIILQEKIKIEPNDTVHNLIMKSKSVVGPGALLRALYLLEHNLAQPKPNPREDATYCSFPTKEDIKRFYRSGKKFR